MFTQPYAVVSKGKVKIVSFRGIMPRGTKYCCVRYAQPQNLAFLAHELGHTFELEHHFSYAQVCGNTAAPDDYMSRLMGLAETGVRLVDYEWLNATPASDAKRAEEITELAKADFEKMLSLDPSVATMRLLHTAQYHTPRGRAAAEVLRRVAGNETYIYLAIAAKLPKANGPKPQHKPGAPYESVDFPPREGSEYFKRRVEIERLFFRCQQNTAGRFVPVVSAFLYEDGHGFNGGDYGPRPVCEMAADTLGMFRLAFDKGSVTDPLVGAIPLSGDVNVLRA